jgi:hypothetical protein
MNLAGTERELTVSNYGVLSAELNPKWYGPFKKRLSLTLVTGYYIRS